jgi:hypothetical protein
VTGVARVLMAVATLAAQAAVAAQTSSTAWHGWPLPEAQRVLKATVGTGRISGGRRLLNTERARSYKLRAIWLSPDVIHAAARLFQIRNRMTPLAIEPLIANLHAPDETIVLIEIDPDEGSGVIPLDWGAFLQPRDEPERGVAGRQLPGLADSKVLAAAFPRNYDYDRFWIGFPLSGPGGPLFLTDDDEAELIVRIHGRDGSVRWRIEPSAGGVWPAAE